MRNQKVDPNIITPHGVDAVLQYLPYFANPNNKFYEIDKGSFSESQNVIPHKKYFGGSLPYVFTEQGIAMLSSILHSERAV